MQLNWRALAIDSPVCGKQVNHFACDSEPEIWHDGWHIVGQESAESANETDAFRPSPIEPIETVHRVPGLKHLWFISYLV